MPPRRSSPSTGACSTTRVVGHVPRIRIEIVLEGPDVEPTLDGLKSCLTSHEAFELWIVTEVLSSGRL